MVQVPHWANVWSLDFQPITVHEMVFPIQIRVMQQLRRNGVLCLSVVPCMIYFRGALRDVLIHKGDGGLRVICWTHPQMFWGKHTNPRTPKGAGGQGWPPTHSPTLRMLFLNVGNRPSGVLHSSSCTGLN